MNICPKCAGRKIIVVGGAIAYSGAVQNIQYAPCPECKGTGFGYEQPDELTALRQQVKTLTEALEWYADAVNYSNYDEDGGYKRHADIEMDRGQQARTALAAAKMDED